MNEAVAAKDEVQKALDETTVARNEAINALEIAETQINALKADAETKAAEAEEIRKGLEEQITSLTKQIEDTLPAEEKGFADVLPEDAEEETADNITEDAGKSAAEAVYVNSEEDDDMIDDEWVDDAVSSDEGWYFSDDGKYAIKPSDIRESYDGYLVSILIRDESSSQILLDDHITIVSPEDGIPSLIPDEAIQDFVYIGDGKYSFALACNIIYDEEDTYEIPYTQRFGFAVN